VGTVGFVPHPGRPQAHQLVREAAAWLEERGHATRIPADEAQPAELGRWAVDPGSFAADLDLAVSVGGDGTMLRAIHLVCAAEVPVLGVNVGHMGYLSEVEPAGMVGAIERWLGGAHRVERRMTLAVEVRPADGPPACHVAVNEAVLQRTATGHTVRVGTYIDGRSFVTYVADGLIVSTPTGSTAYNLSARGPIVSPRHRALVLTPVSPHMLFNLAMVLDGSEEVRLEVLDGRPAELVVDGQPVGVLEEGDAVTCAAGPHDARLVSQEGESTPRRFHQIVKAKFGLATEG